jgi:peptidoglycan/LPS O-acetylase OafA/YrhL
MATVVVCSVLALLLMSETEEHPRIYKQILLSLVSLGNLGAFSYSGDYFLANPNPFVHAWSLSVEVQIYLLLPLFLLLLSRILILTEELIKRTYLLFGLLSLFLFSLMLLPNLNTSIRELIFYLPFSRFWQFACGGLFSFWPARKMNLGAYSTSFNIILLLSAMFLLFLPLKLDSVLGAILATAIAVLIVHFECLSVIPSVIGKTLGWVGDRSYSIYLIHMPFLYLAKYSDVFFIPDASGRALQSLLAIALTLLLGSLNYYFVEQRFRSKNLRANGIPFKKVALVSFCTPVIV